MWQEAAVSLVTSLSRGTEAAHHHHSNCQGDGNLWESHTLCHCSDTCQDRVMNIGFKVSYKSHKEHLCFCEQGRVQ